LERGAVIGKKVNKKQKVNDADWSERDMGGQKLVDELASFFESLKAGDAAELRSMFKGEPQVDTPLWGPVPPGRFDSFVEESGKWCVERNAHTRVVNSAITPDRAVLELIMDLDHEGRHIELPVALSADIDSDRATAVRVYHSTYPLNGKHAIRKPLLEPVSDLPEPEVMNKYMKGLAEGDIDQVLPLFTPDGYIREPSGDAYRHQGPEDLRGFFEPAFTDGGVPLKHCAVTFDGKTFAVEFTVDMWGRTRFETQGGMAVYQLTDDGKKIEGARIYDDVTPPNEG
jgi:hypothetical protein